MVMAMPDVSAKLYRSVRAVAILSRHFERRCLEIGLSLPQYRLMLFVRRGPQRAAELAARAAVRRPTLTALVDGLEKEGLLARKAVEGDRRGIRLELTEKGYEVLDQTEKELGALIDRVIEGDKRERILTGLDDLAGVLERGIEAFYRNQR